MEKQTKHRILGVIVLIGIIIILLPLFQTRKELQTDTSIVKAPPFPEQSVPSVTSDVPTTAIPLPTEQEPENPSAADKVSQQPDDTIQSAPTNTQQTMPTIPDTNTAEPEEGVVEKKKVTQLDPNAVDTDDLAPAPAAPSLVAEKTEEPVVAKPVVKPHPAPKATVAVEPVKAAPHVSSLAELKESAWVVQIGSFKNKDNALRLVNKLRASGYRAFHQDMATAAGTNTRVFVGPENKRNSARVMAIQLEKDLNLHGVVLNYKPLEL